MSSVWQPDDSLLQVDENGETRGVKKIRDALIKHGVKLGNRVITSQDEGMESVQRDLRRQVTPQIEHWQLPFAIHSDRDIICFISVMQPRAKVPEHSHEHSALRVVMQGSVRFERLELKERDWMWVPAGVTYALEAGDVGCIILYPHPIPWPWPW